MGRFARWLRREREEVGVGEEGVVYLVGGKLSYVDTCLFDAVQAVEEVGFFTAEDITLCEPSNASRTSGYPSLSSAPAWGFSGFSPAGCARLCLGRGWLAAGAPASRASSKKIYFI